MCFRRNLKDWVLRFAGIVSSLKSRCNTLGVWNGGERAFKCCSISIRNEITAISSKFERLGFAICSDCYDAESNMQ
jgi:basic membrane lipoprotein Med (substrate-binding protein (PBP1-ABC) superfamily)